MAILLKNSDMYNMHIRKLNTLGVTNVGNGYIIDFLNTLEVFRDLTQKKWVTKIRYPYFI